jgi:hypothetical protein
LARLTTGSGTLALTSRFELAGGAVLGSLLKANRTHRNNIHAHDAGL